MRQKVVLAAVLLGACLIAAIASAAKEDCEIQLSDGNRILGTLETPQLQVSAVFGTISVGSELIESFNDGAFRLCDGSVLKGKFGDERISVLTSFGELNVETKGILSLKILKRPGVVGCDFWEDFSDPMLDSQKWRKTGRKIDILYGGARTTYSGGTGVLVTQQAWGGGTYRVTIKTTSDGHTFPNINYMRSDKSDWGWSGYRFYFSVFDSNIAFGKIPGSGNILWRSTNASVYRADESYVVEVIFGRIRIRGRITRKSDDKLMDSFEVQDDTYRRGYFGLRGETYSTSVASWDEVCIISEEE